MLAWMCRKYERPGHISQASKANESADILFMEHGEK